MLLAELGQVCIALGFSVTVAIWTGPIVYFAIAAFVCLTSALLMVSHARQISPDATGRETMMILLTTGIGAIVFGAIWPALPPILGYSSWRRKSAPPTSG